MKAEWTELWPTSVSFDHYQQMICKILHDYYGWYADASPVAFERCDNAYVGDEAKQLLTRLSTDLKASSAPWAHPLYLAHMNTDVLLASSIAYFTTMLYNPNNVTPEVSPVTTQLECELSDDFCQMFNFNPRQGWAHLTSGGHAANYEAIWMARNMKSIAQAALTMETLRSKWTKDSINPSPDDVASLLDYAGRCGELPRLMETARKTHLTNPGHLLVAANCHYAWDKCADLLGVELDLIPVDAFQRMDIRRLRDKVFALIAAKQPIIAVVATVGSSGEGSIDQIHEIIAVKHQCEQRYGASFFIHADAAFGGYFKNLLIPATPKEPLVAEPLKPEIADALCALDCVDSITVDPHKCGHIPYPAGCLVIRDRRFSYVIARKSKYFGQLQQPEYMDFGAHTLEGARPGAAVAAVWIAHRLLGLHRAGYGKLLAGYVTTAKMLHQTINDSPAFLIAGERYRLYSLLSPDLCMLNFIVLPLEAQEHVAKTITTFSEIIITDKINYGEDCAPWFSRNKLIYPLSLQDGAIVQQEIVAVRCCVMHKITQAAFPQYWQDIFSRVLARLQATIVHGEASMPV